MLTAVIVANGRSELIRKQAGRRTTELGAGLRGEKRVARPRRASYTIGSSNVPAAVAVAQATPLGQWKNSFRGAPPCSVQFAHQCRACAIADFAPTELAATVVSDATAGILAPYEHQDGRAHYRVSCPLRWHPGAHRAKVPCRQSCTLPSPKL